MKIKTIADKWITSIGTTLAAKVEKQVENDFRAQIISGHKLSFSEIQALSSEYQDLYF